uniref:Uncharacterized protein n=1 Tax=viral metagenome TaxID=1070528 RepID=A0A6C0JLJ7_9ZZZZ
MDIPDNVIKHWQDIWRTLCDMAYNRKNIVPKLWIEISNYDKLLYYKNNSRNFDEITFDYIWKQISSTVNPDGTYLEPSVVTELEAIYIPRIIFQSPGVSRFFSHSFPNCTILFWEYDM